MKRKNTFGQHPGLLFSPPVQRMMICNATLVTIGCTLLFSMHCGILLANYTGSNNSHALVNAICNICVFPAITSWNVHCETVAWSTNCVSAFVFLWRSLTSDFTILCTFCNLHAQRVPLLVYSTHNIYCICLPWKRNTISPVPIGVFWFFHIQIEGPRIEGVVYC